MTAIQLAKELTALIADGIIQPDAQVQVLIPLPYPTSPAAIQRPLYDLEVNGDDQPVLAGDDGEEGF